MLLGPLEQANRYSGTRRLRIYTLIISDITRGQLIKYSLRSLLLEFFLDFAEVDGRATAAAFGAARVLVGHKTAVKHPTHVGHRDRENQENDNLLYHTLYQLHKFTKSLEATLILLLEAKRGYLGFWRDSF